MTDYKSDRKLKYLFLTGYSMLLLYTPSKGGGTYWLGCSSKQPSTRNYITYTWLKYFLCRYNRC